MSTLAEQRLICTRPFEWCEIHPGGSIFLCCPGWLKRPLGNILEQDIDTLWNGPLAQEIRKSILNHSFHNCNSRRCPFLSTQTEPVSPVASVQNAEVRTALEQRQTQLDYYPRRLNLCFDDSCNLSCSSCRSEIHQAFGKELETCELVAERIIDQLLPQAHEITLSGFGDPFGSPTYLRLLHDLNQQPDGPDLRLHTNAQLWTEQLWAALPALHSRISAAEISIDAATTETYALNRSGGSFSRLLNNLEFISRLCLPLTLSMVVQANNYREIPAFIDLANQFNATAYFSKLVNWGTFSQLEYRLRAVHIPEHPDHAEFHSLLIRAAAHPRVKIGNLLACIDGG
ncbi:MAG: SPASM domain-containing protein [Desulfuromonadales bacterium]|nr:SPASM domain-containing protein [Desulfuromonadales bacterium]MBN2791009.1 SPASM domain-containing protein [Desulfuromonadales bacterium]